MQYNVKREATKIYVLSSGKIDRYQYLTGELIPSLDQSRIIDQAKSTYFLYKKVFDKQTKTLLKIMNKLSWSLKILKSSKETITIDKKFHLKRKLNPEIVNEIKCVEKFI